MRMKHTVGARCEERRGSSHLPFRLLGGLPGPPKGGGGE
jgi:hypothetical protein